MQQVAAQLSLAYEEIVLAQREVYAVARHLVAAKDHVGLEQLSKSLPKVPRELDVLDLRLGIEALTQSLREREETKVPLRRSPKQNRSNQAIKRVTALKLLEEGDSCISIAKRLGVHRRTVYKWRDEHTAHGDKITIRSDSQSRIKRKAGSEPGRNPSLTPGQELRILRWVSEKLPLPQQGKTTALWTRDALRFLILKKFGIKFSETAIKNFANRWGFTQQNPWLDTPDSCPPHIFRWLTETYPSIESGLKKRDNTLILWCYIAPINGSNNMPSGQSMISAIGGRGKREHRFMLFRGELNKTVLLSFLQRLVRHELRRMGRLLLIVNLDSVLVDSVRSWLDENRQKIELIELPAC